LLLFPAIEQRPAASMRCTREGIQYKRSSGTAWTSAQPV